jgi:hypothetical protein
LRPISKHAAAVGAAGLAELVLSEPRLTGSAWEPLAALGRLTLLEDGDGGLFTDELLAQELRKHPPARALAASPLLRREHWWYLPRLVLLLEAPEVVPLRSREGPGDAVLAVDDGGLPVATVRVPDREAAPLAVQGGPDGVRARRCSSGRRCRCPTRSAGRST